MISKSDLAVILNQLSPMYLLLDSSGHVERVGGTLQKLRPDQPLQGRRFLELFQLTRPRSVSTMSDLTDRAGIALHLNFRDAPATGFKGVLVPLPGGQGAIVNLSFGISVLDAVQDYALTSADFPVTDLTIEMLYLVEAKSAAMEASRKLNMRLQGAMIAAEEQAFTDTLTGLKNRRAMDYVLDRLITGNGQFALMHLDLDFFKQVNDTHGHAAGDHILQHAARIMLDETRDTDTIARVGGDEFVLLLDDLTDHGRLNQIARNLIAAMENPVNYRGQICRISASIGTTVCRSRNRVAAPKLLHQADLALYAAKKAGRAAHVIYSPRLEPDGPHQSGLSA